jgi:two-component system, OmpR family, sensor histidine kinase BaeS
MPRAVSGMGCTLAAMILFTAISVKLLTFAPRGVAAVAGIALLLMIVFTAIVVIRRIRSEFAEQVRLRRQLMADVAHELRTPLAILQGRIEGLLDGVYPRDDERLEELLAETRHLSRLVEDVRTLANAEAGALELRIEDVELAELIRDAAGAIDPAIEVSTPDVLPVRADPVRIREVLLNLLSNAMQHAPDGRVSVAAETVGDHVSIRVRDNGPGIAADELPRLFERFQKGRDSRGSGLGLAISQKLVLAHGGTIDVESAEGGGTTVTVTLKRSSAAARE